jgi:hypothetical protein
MPVLVRFFSINFRITSNKKRPSEESLCNYLVINLFVTKFLNHRLSNPCIREPAIVEKILHGHVAC